MSGNTTFRQNLQTLRDEWKNLDPTLRNLDLTVISLVFLFGISYILVNLFDVTLTVTNGAMLIFPIILAGYTFVLRTKLADENIENNEAKREYSILVGVTLFLVLLTAFYGFFLSLVL